MSSDPTTLAAASDILFREALALDEQRFDDWLALYHAEAEFWVPAWKSESEPTADPETEVSLIYSARRVDLEERVWRARSGRSVASIPLPRTAHIVSNVLLAPSDDPGILEIRSLATTHLFNVKRREQRVFFARVAHRLVDDGGTWFIRRKKIILLNDYLPTMLDFYCI
ncbi:MAG: aromatic-ring-hydroxylating dioxygenase subunit beta [Rhodospirillales bacterium]|nr:aromatic-ring-hydroxylating dioxygenase subunit beta [Rhodospirillales bacterium]